MSVKEFDKIFGLESSLEDEKKRFVNRIENKIYYHFTQSYARMRHDASIFRDVCYLLGEDADEFIDRYKRIPDFNVLSYGDFVKSLRVLVALYRALKNKPQDKIFLESHIINALELANRNLGIRWTEGVFYPTGDDLLDKELIETSLSLLDKFPSEKKDLENALENYYSKSMYGVVENCYLSIEGLSRKILSNSKTLDSNKEDLLRTLQFSKYCDKIFLNYLNYAHEYRRHAGENRHDLKPAEVEGFLYLSCLIIRATVRTYVEKK
jgi:hypothetical protein